MQKKVVEGIYKRMKQSVPVGTKVCKSNNVYKNCFIASEAVDWLVKNKRSIAAELKGKPLSARKKRASCSRQKAQEVAELLRKKGYIRHVQNRTKKFTDGEGFFRFVKNFEGLLHHPLSNNHQIRIACNADECLT